MNERIQAAVGSVEKIALELSTWLRAGDHWPLAIALTVCGLGLAFAMGVMIRWLANKRRARRAATRNSQRIVARRYHEKVWGWH